jgi:hypothetical protein
MMVFIDIFPGPTSWILVVIQAAELKLAATEFALQASIGASRLGTQTGLGARAVWRISRFPIS